LRHELPQLLDEADLPDEIRNNMLFQHDGAPAHSSRRIREELDRTYPDSWIGRGGPIHWPAQSPDLTPLDYFLWGHLKNFIYKNLVETEEEMIAELHSAFATVDEEMLQRSVDDIIRRTTLCMQQNGEHFENLL